MAANNPSRYLTGGVNTADRRDRTHFFAETDTAKKSLCGVGFVRVENFDANLIIEFGEIESLCGPRDAVDYLKTDFAFTEEFVRRYHVCGRCVSILRRRLTIGRTTIMNDEKVKPFAFDRKGDELWLEAAHFWADPANTSEPLPETLTIEAGEATRVYLHGQFLGIILESGGGAGGDFYAIDPQNRADKTLYKIDSRPQINGLEWRNIYEAYLRRVIPGLGKTVESNAGLNNQENNSDEKDESTVIG